ncbi:MAG: large conductance mechanosensitive channel protein MscL [Candidatus Bipolaricaulota bacterium]
MRKEFRDFIAKGNLVQLAVAFVMGVAFGTVVSSFVNDLVMPIVGKLVGNVDFANLYINLSETAYASAADARAAGAAAIYYGAFINTVINFLVVALVLFFIVRVYQRSQKPKVEAAPSTKTCPHCKSTIALDATRCPHCTSQLG